MYWNKYWSRLLLGVSLFNEVISSPTPFHHRHLSPRKERTPDDATKPVEIFKWLEEEEIDDKHLVFYSGGKQADALKFVEANEEYAYFWDLFDKEHFMKDFHLAEMDTEVTEACSEAMASYAAGETRIFGDKDGGEDGVWKRIEKPILMKANLVTRIWSMKDGTTDPGEHPDGDLKSGGTTLPTKTLQLFWTEFTDEISGVTHYWQFYVGDAGKGVNPCNAKPIHQGNAFPAPNSDQPPATVNGEWSLKVEGMDCKFQGIGRKGAAGEIGYLHCPNKAATMCFPDGRTMDHCGSGHSADTKAIAFCNF